MTRSARLSPGEAPNALRVKVYHRGEGSERFTDPSGEGSRGVEVIRPESTGELAREPREVHPKIRR